MIRWQAKPLWETLEALASVHALQAGDMLTLTLIDAAQAPVWVRKRYRGLDQLKSRLRVGEPGVIIRLRP